ncbi:MAG: thioredoxin family protein [Ramlibacter sp.]
MQIAETPTDLSRADVDALRGATMLEFGTSWCGHCQRAQPLIHAAMAAHSGVRHLKVEDGSGRLLGRTYQVKLWPTLVFLKDGQEVARLVRPGRAEDISQALAQLAG